MSNATDRPIPYAAQERAPHLVPAYCYVVQMEDGTSWFLTNRDRPVTVSGLPAEMGASDPQTFLPAQVRHSAVESKDRFEETTTTLTVLVQDSALQRYFLTAAAVKLKAWIMRGQSETTDGATLVFAENVIVVQSGILGKVGFKGNTIAVEITPEPFYVDGRIPRKYFGRECDHFLYAPRFQGVGCGVDKELFKFETTIAAITPAQRTITLTGQRPDTPENFFNRGHFENLTIGGKMSIAWGVFNGGDTDLKLVTWNPELAIGQNIKAFGGCLHTVAACRLFGNQANFGNFPDVPDRTPLAGVA